MSGGDLLERVDRLEARVAELEAGQNYSDREMRLVAERDDALTRAETAEARLQAVAPPLRVGQSFELLLRVLCTVVDAGDDGSVQIKLDQRSFQRPEDREIALEADEVVGGRSVSR